MCEQGVWIGPAVEVGDREIAIWERMRHSIGESTSVPDGREQASAVGRLAAHDCVFDLPRTDRGDDVGVRVHRCAVVA